MKHTITQYITLGVMLFLLFFLVSLLPEQQPARVSTPEGADISISTAKLPMIKTVARDN